MTISPKSSKAKACANACVYLSALLCLTALPAPVFSQGGSPLPGAASSAPLGGAPSPGAAPAPGSMAQQGLAGPNSIYRRLPLNYQNAAVRLEELRNIMVTAKPKEFQDAMGDYLDWLADMADAHWKIYQAFSKIDSMKPQADVEKNATLKIGGLKRQAMLLKAEFLIRENRQPEALTPLVDIVVAEPKTATGEAAYAMLKQIGFSDEISLNSAAPTGSASKQISIQPAAKAIPLSVDTRQISTQPGAKPAGKNLAQPAVRQISKQAAPYFDLH